ncbi:uncharacterized protein LOC131286999 [Anopheles ziemanni]|uniref:uncharacterized protein LOC131272438 n=1 Tax=Anopheles coustani TaxID=139045 RepID=UPI00265B530C|nr:uncharacterized protein LOC131272438 [Anopheles coustani]XP_058171996.1 uncharacterized protein LOC131286999 [Anopheles ziemanni]
MEYPCIESETAMIEVADVNNETEDPSAKVATCMVAPSMKQVYSWINDGAAGNMCVEEIEMEEIKREPSYDSDPSRESLSKPLFQIATEKAEENGQTGSSLLGTAAHNENRYRRLRCKFCPLLFYSEKTLTNHQRKCQLVCERMNVAKAAPDCETKGILEDLQKRLPQFTIAITGKEDVGASSCTDDGTPVPHHRKSASVPIEITVKTISEIEALTTPPIQYSSSSLSTTSSIDNQNQAVLWRTLPPEIALQLERIENKLAQLKEENCLLRQALAVSLGLPIEEHNDSDASNFERLDTENQMEEFNEKLGEDATFADTMVTLLKLKAAHCNPKNRIVLSLDFLFSRQLFAKCSWTGIGRSAPKLPFGKFKNILTLLQRVSGASFVFVESCVRNRLCHSNERLHGNSGRKAYCKLGGSSDKTRCISPLAEHNELNVFNFEQLDNEKKMKEFEEKLGKDAAFADNIVTLLKMKAAHWNPKHRIVLSLDFLFSRQLFASCTWTGAGRSAPKIPLGEFKNIHSLLKRVSGLSGISVEKCLRSRLRQSNGRLRGLPGRKPYCKLG